MTAAAEILIRKLGFEDCGPDPKKVGMGRWLKQRSLPHILIEVPEAENAEEDWLVDAIYRAGMKHQQEITAGKWQEFLACVKMPPKAENCEPIANPPL